MRSLVFGFALSLTAVSAHAAMSSTATVYGKVMIVDKDKIVMKSNNNRVEIPAKYVKDKFAVGETAYIDIPQDELKNLKVEPLSSAKKAK